MCAAHTFCCVGGGGAGRPAPLPLDTRLMAATAFSAKLENSGGPALLGETPRLPAAAPGAPPSSAALPGLYRNCCIMLRPLTDPAARNKPLRASTRLGSLATTHHQGQQVLGVWVCGI